jgi:outer membrane lipoprotein SlyB
MRRTLLALGLAGALALTGCGASTPAASAADIADEAMALQQVGFDTGLADTPTPTASDGTGDAPRRQQLRKYLRKNTLHGEVTIQTKKQGTKTVVVQRGEVTAVDAGKVTVKSSDGFTLTWTFGDKLRVVQDRKTVDKSALKTGVQIGIAGTKNGDATGARLIAIT